MKKKKRAASSLCPLLIADRLSANFTPKKHIQRNSVTEYTGISILSENLSVFSKSIGIGKSVPSDTELYTEKYKNVLESIDFTLSIPPRLSLNSVEPCDYKKVESIIFNHWKSLQRVAIFERNIEVWRQLWLACEKADIIAQIVDSRHPEKYINQDLLKLFPTKKHILLCNKFDLIDSEESLKILDIQYYAYSATSKEVSFDFKLSGKVCLVGYPNVGKSSTINMILNRKKVRVSSTPEKTRALQTIETPDFTLIDTPGLVFPRHEKLDLILMGVLNTDHVPDIVKYSDQIVARIGGERISKIYKLRRKSSSVLSDLSDEKGWTVSKCIKIIVKDYIKGVLM